VIFTCGVRGAGTAGLAMLLAGCAVGPRYVRPLAPLPPSYKEAVAPAEGWKVLEPRDDSARGSWWRLFDDPELAALESRIEVSSQALKAAEARFRQARALVRSERSALLPTVQGGASATRTRLSGDRPFSASARAGTSTDIVLSADASYEVDVWGRVRRAVEARRADAEASAADLEAVRLSLTAELAVDYFELRSLDAEKTLLQTTAWGYEKALELTQNRYRGGIASQVDVAQAEAQLQATRAQAIDTGVRRSQMEHAIATLVGEPASAFSLLVDATERTAPRVPPGVPSELLERRPDVAAAERRVAAASARIGVAQAAYFPAVTLSAAGGSESTAVDALLSGPSAVWSIAGRALEMVFDGGRRRAASQQARAAYDESVAAYRQTVLASVQEVEDQLAALAVLEAELTTQDSAVAAARRSLELSTNRYKGGIVSYLEVISAQSTVLTDERAAVDLRRRHRTASLLLIKAIGGGW
jgi:NodT family efflux transporter outer membrane factor (OMF) lipoprotein